MTSSNAASAGTAWSKERVALLAKLWAEGLSASRIAGRLGGLSRNAVMGKIHRLGLPGRQPSARARPGPSRPRLPERPAPEEAGEPEEPSLWRTEGALALKPAAASASALAPAPLARTKAALRLAFAAAPEATPAVPPAAVSLLALKESMCRWPGDGPGTEPVRFCGRPKLDGLSYCAGHARIAYKPSNSAHNTQKNRKKIMNSGSNAAKFKERIEKEGDRRRKIEYE